MGHAWKSKFSGLASRNEYSSKKMSSSDDTALVILIHKATLKSTENIVDSVGPKLGVYSN